MAHAKVTTTCKDLGYMKVQGADRPCATFQMQPGEAYLLDAEGTDHKIATITEAGVKAGVYTYILRWINGVTVAVFKITKDGKEYELAQPIPLAQPDPPKRKVEKPAPKVEAKPAPKVEKPKVEAKPKAKAAVTPAPEEKPSKVKAPKLRKLNW